MASQTQQLDPNYIRLKELFNPIEPDPYPASKVTTDAYSASAQAFLSLDTSPYSSYPTRMNVDGQQWQSAGFGYCKNVPTPRMVSGVAPGHVIEFEFDWSDDRFDLMLNAFGDYDTQIYVTENGKTWKLRADPLGETGTAGYRFRNVKLTTRAERQIRVVIAGAAYFVQLNHEGRAVIRPSKSRPMILSDGDSYTDGFHAFNAGSVEPSFYSYGVLDAIFEATGFISARHSEGQTGAFNNGDGTARTDDTAYALTQSSRWWSAQRLAKMALPLGLEPIVYLCNGTINDGPLSGGKAPYKARLYQGWESLVNLDPGLPIVHVGPEPFDGSHLVPPGSPWGAGSAHDLNRQGIIEAGRAFANFIGFIDPALDPQGPWFAGSGYNNSPIWSKQAALTGGDKIHGTKLGYQHYGTQIAKALGELAIPRSRAERYL